jgi:hypothetical protein
MKILKYLTVGIFALMASTANASTTLIANDGNVNFLFGDLGEYDLYMFDDDDFGSTTDNLLVPLPSVVGISGPQTDTDGIYHLASNLNGILRLDGDPAKFVLGISNDGENFIMDSNPVWYPNGNAVTLYFNIEEDERSVLTVDVQPIPVPAAVWLFGSGLLGLVGVARRRA